MDWKRAKTILIWVFIALNIVLAVILYRNIIEGEISQDTIDSTKKILEQNDVYIECPIPKYSGKDYMLQYEDTTLKKNEIINGLLGDNYSIISDNIYEKGTKRLAFSENCSFEYSDSGSSEKINVESKSDTEKYLKDLAQKLGIPFNEFQLDSFYSLNSGEGLKAVYKGSYNGYSVFDNYIEAVIGKTGLTSLKYQYKKPLAVTGRDINIIPVYQILVTKMTNYPGIDISNVAIGFKGIKVDKDTKTLWEGLSWRIKTNEGKEFYFNATNGEIIQ